LTQTDNKTLLQRAHIPAMDRLARLGHCGLMDPVEPGLACGSDTAHLSIFGYDPRIYYTGRGAFEAIGAGAEMYPGDIAFKSNFATMTGDVVSLRRCDRKFPSWGIPLCRFLTENIKLSDPSVSVIVEWATEHRCAVILRGKNLTDKITGTDPLKDELSLIRSEPLDDSAEAARTAQLVNETSKKITALLESHELILERKAQGLPYSNVILLRGPAMMSKVPSFHDRHGFKAFMIAPTAIISGIGHTLGMSNLSF